MRSSKLVEIWALCLALSSTTFSLPSSINKREEDDTPLVRLLYEYPQGSWIENIAIRPSGELLLTRLDKPHLDQLDPFQESPTPETVHSFSGLLALSGITEITPDSFAVIAGNQTFTTGAQLGSWSVWNVAFSASHATDSTVNKIADMPNAKSPNGMCALPSTSAPANVLVGDLDQGVIRRVDTSSGKVELVVNNSLTAASASPLFGKVGVNGIKIKDQILYLTNSATTTFASLPIDDDGTPAGEGSIITTVHKSPYVFYFDDFAIQGQDAYLVTGAGNSIERIGLDGTPKGQIIAGSLNSTLIAEPTAAAFGRTQWDSHILYVTTSGGLLTPVDGIITVGAQVLAVNTRKWPC